MKREALEESAAANVWERVGISEPPVHLGRLERGQRVVLGPLVVGSEDLDRPANDTPEDGLHVLILRRRQGHKASGTVLAKRKDPVRRQRVEMYVEVESASCSLDRGDAASPRIDRPEPAGGLALPGEDGPREDVEQARGESGMACCEKAHLAGEGEHPLAHWNGGEDVADQSGRTRGPGRLRGVREDAQAWVSGAVIQRSGLRDQADGQNPIS